MANAQFADITSGISAKVNAQFSDITFRISAAEAMLFSGLKMSAEAETEEKTENEQKFVSFKNGKAANVSMTAIVNASFGVNVEQTVERLLNRAQRGTTGHLYIAGRKIFPFLLMLTKAETDEIQQAPNGQWTAANVSLTFHQASSEWIGEESGEAGGASTGGANAGGWDGTPQKQSSKRSGGVRAKGMVGELGKPVDNNATGQDRISTAQEVSTAQAVADAKRTTSQAKTTPSVIAKGLAGLVKKPSAAK